ncbi:hypothetical protein EJ065_7353 [Corallococcus coralloides]|uniref:Uncharacterized protein n=1 Tax=Corallococcus coralloides TaxID=184914 RepID=A0A410S3U7_CORCK|nr:hypothetical protein EJ065_7353 [Corallococcus coralloides]
MGQQPAQPLRVGEDDGGLHPSQARHRVVAQHGDAVQGAVVEQWQAHRVLQSARQRIQQHHARTRRGHGAGALGEEAQHGPHEQAVAPVAQHVHRVARGAGALHHHALVGRGGQRGHVLPVARERGAVQRGEVPQVLQTAQVARVQARLAQHAHVVGRAPERVTQGRQARFQRRAGGGFVHGGRASCEARGHVQRPRQVRALRVAVAADAGPGRDPERHSRQPRASASLRWASWSISWRRSASFLRASSTLRRSVTACR